MVNRKFLCNRFRVSVLTILWMTTFKTWVQKAIYRSLAQPNVSLLSAWFFRKILQVLASITPPNLSSKQKGDPLWPVNIDQSKTWILVHQTMTYSHFPQSDSALLEMIKNYNLSFKTQKPLKKLKQTHWVRTQCLQLNLLCILSLQARKYCKRCCD